MIAFSFVSNLWRGKKKIYTESLLICLIHSQGNAYCDLLIEDVCIWLMVSFSSAAPYPGSSHILTVCSKAPLREYLHCLCLQNRNKRNSKLLPSSLIFLHLHLQWSPVSSVSRDGSPSGLSPFSCSVHRAAFLHIVLQTVTSLIV